MQFGKKTKQILMITTENGIERNGMNSALKNEQEDIWIKWITTTA